MHHFLVILLTHLKKKKKTASHTHSLLFSSLKHQQLKVLMVGQIVLTYQRRRFSSRNNGPNVSPPLEISVSKSSTDSNKHLAQNMTRECEDGNLGSFQRSCVQSEAEVRENLLLCENGPTQFNAEYINHDKIAQYAESLEETVKSSGQEEISERNEASASGTNNRWSSRLITYRRRSKQNNKKSVPDAEDGLISKKIKVDDHQCIIAELDLSAAVQIVQNPVTCEARTSVMQKQRHVQDNDHTNCLSVKPIGLPVDNPNPTGSLCTMDSCDVDYNQALHCSSEGKILTRTLDVHLSIGLINKMTKLDGDFVYQAGAVGIEGKELADSGKSNYLQLFPESRSNNTTVRINISQKDSAFTCPQYRWCQLKPATMQSSTPYNVLQQQQMINAYASSPSLYNWPSLNIKSSDAFDNFLHHNWDPAPERPGHHNLMSSLPATWTDLELDSLWIGVRRHGRGNWEMMLRDQKLQFLPGKTPQDLAERWEEEYSHLLNSRRGYQSSGPVDLLCHRVGTHPCERKGQLQHPVANTATISPYSYFRSSSVGLFNPYGANGMPQVDSWSGAGQVNCTREPALLALRPSRTRPLPPACCLRTLQQPDSNDNSFDSIARQAEFQNYMRACPENPPPVTGHLNVGTSEHSDNEELIVLPGGAPSEKTICDDVSNEHT